MKWYLCTSYYGTPRIITKQGKKLPTTFETVAGIISETSDIPLDEITPEKNAFTDLDIDSLDFPDIAFAIDKSFGIKIPLEKWTEELNENNASADDYFVLSKLCDRIDELVAAKDAGSKSSPALLEYFQTIDAVEELDSANGRIVARSDVPLESTVFQGHFPGSPLVPGVLPIETMAQASGFMLLSLKFDKMPFLANVTSAKMRSFVEPGDVLRVEAELEHDGSGFAATTARISRDGKKICGR